MMSKTPVETYKPSPGKLRTSQLITTFGPGALMQTEYDSVLIMGTNFWWHKNKFSIKNHMYLQKITGKTHFRMPVKKGREQSIVCMSFPKWGSCKSCKWLQYHKDYPPDEKGFHCAKCSKKYGELLPARLVVVCKQGHLDEFPWVEWAHSRPRNHPNSVGAPICKENPKLKWKGGKMASSISNYTVECECGEWNSLSNSQDREDGIRLWDSENNTWYTHSCTGQRPWLEQEEPCRRVLPDGTKHKTETEIAFGITARASSLYYSKVIRGIIIPSLAHPIVKYLTSTKGEERIAAGRDFDKTDEEIAENLSEKVPEFKIKSYTKEDILYFMKKIQSRMSKHVLETEMDLKKIEYDDLRKNEEEHDLDKKEIEPEIVIKSVPLDDDQKKIFDDVRQIPILTALEVPRYFTRINPPGEVNLNNQSSKHNICHLESKGGKTIHGRPTKKQDWLPCVVKKGEGIFIVFNKDFINNCLSDNDLHQRLGDMKQNHDDWESYSNWPPTVKIDHQFILLHSISHLIIKEIALESGYNEASISERIYSTEEMCGLLIYTTSAGDGSLGGLVRQSTHLLDIIKKALNHKSVCSRDPICINENPKRMKVKGLPLNLRQNGSACFGCMLLPETSCENFNKMLDRKILVDEEYGIKKMIPND
jgi:hypothetical protein